MKNYPRPSCSSKAWIVTKVELIFAQQITELDNQHPLKSFFMFYVSLFIPIYYIFLIGYFFFWCGFSHQRNQFHGGKEICIPDNSLIPFGSHLNKSVNIAAIASVCLLKVCIIKI